MKKTLAYFLLYTLMLALVFASGVKYESYRNMANISEQVAAISKQKDEFALVLQQHSTKTIKEINELWQDNTELYGRVEREIIREEVYKDCVLPPSGKDIIKSARGEKK